MAWPVGPDKRCPRCGETKPRSDFPRYWVASRGCYRAGSYCHPCRNAKGRAEYHEHREERAEACRRWREENAEYDRLRHKRYEAEHREEVNARARRFRERHPGYGVTYRDQYRARVRGQFAEHVDPLVVLEMDDGFCGICGEDVDPFAFHVDHIFPISAGGVHSYANVQVAHPSCNLAKSNSIPEDAVAG